MFIKNEFETHHNNRSDDLPVIKYYCEKLCKINYITERNHIRIFKKREKKTLLNYSI